MVIPLLHEVFGLFLRLSRFPSNAFGTNRSTLLVTMQVFQISIQLENNQKKTLYFLITFF